MHLSSGLFVLAFLCILTARLAAHDTPVDPNDPLLALPELPKPRLIASTTPAIDPTVGTAMSPAIRFVAGKYVVLDGVMQIDKGPEDGLEVAACFNQSNKTPETLVRLATSDGVVVKMAMLGAFGLPDGSPAYEDSGIPARGVPMRMQVMWKDENSTWQMVDAGNLIRDRRTDRVFPALPWVYTGSRLMMVTYTGADGKPIQRQRFMLDVTQTVAAIYDQEDSLLASPFPCAAEDVRFEANSGLCPPPQTHVYLVISPAEVVLELRLDVGGNLIRAGAICDDTSLSTALATAFGKASTPPHRAITIRTAQAASDKIVLAARARILAIAKTAQVWAVPIFQPE